MNYMEFEGKKIHYTVSGNGSPILFGHSYLWDHHMWDTVIDFLKENFTCICIDLPGHGESESIENISLQKLADINKKVLEELGFKKIYLAGLSVGAMWGAYLASESGLEVEKFAVINSSLLPEPAETKNLYLGMLDTIEQAGCIPQPIIDHIAPGFFSEKARNEYLDKFKLSLAAISADKIKSVAGIGRAFVLRENLCGLLKGKQTLIISGEFDLYRSVEEGRQMEEILDSNLITVPSGHISALENPVDLAGILKKFFQG